MKLDGWLPVSASAVDAVILELAVSEIKLKQNA